jgi:predicted MFS family arabinose efflux permease
LRHLDPNTIFYLLALLSAPALYFALSLPNINNKTQHVGTRKSVMWPSLLNAITLVSAILIDGIVVVVLGVLFLHYRENITVGTATTLAAFYLGYRRVCLVALSPAAGWIADRVGLDRVFNASIVLVVLGLIVIVFGWIGTGALIVFTFYSINAAVAPGSATQADSHSLAAVAENATWRDIGAAVGTLIGGLLISSQHISTILSIAIVVLIVLLFFRFSTSQNAHPRTFASLASFRLRAKGVKRE